MRKFILIIGGGLLALILVAMIVFAIFINPIIKTGLETLGPQITKVSIKVNAVDLSVLTGSVHVKGLTIGNPSGYKSPNAIKLDTVSVSLSPMSVFSDKIVVHSIHVISPEITYEGGLGGNNLSKIMDNVNSIAKQGGPSSEKPSVNQIGADKKPAPKIEVDDFLITGAKVHVFLKGLSTQDMVMTIPSIHLMNLGKESNGITPTELIRVVMSQVTGSIVPAVTNVIPGTVKGLKDLGVGVGTKAEENINTITKGIDFVGS